MWNYNGEKGPPREAQRTLKSIAGDLTYSEIRGSLLEKAVFDLGAQDQQAITGWRSENEPSRPRKRHAQGARSRNACSKYRSVGCTQEARIVVGRDEVREVGDLANMEPCRHWEEPYPFSPCHSLANLWNKRNTREYLHNRDCLITWGIWVP